VNAEPKKAATGGGSIGAWLREQRRLLPPAVFALVILRPVLLIAAPFVGIAVLRVFAANTIFVAPLHRRLIYHPALHTAGLLYQGIVALVFTILAETGSTALRSIVEYGIKRTAAPKKDPTFEEKKVLPAWPYQRESFTAVLGELQDRDGSRVPNEKSPTKVPRWLTLPELALYTSIFVTGAVGSGKTAAVAYPLLRQLLGFRRKVPVRQRDGSLTEQEWKFSGLILDEKGDFTRAAAAYAAEWGREDDIIRISPGGRWKCNVIYNPNIPAWANGYQLGWMLKSFNKKGGGDPFWENAPKELTLQYLTLLDDAESYYTMFEYLETLLDDTKQNALHEKAMARHAADKARVLEMERRWVAIKKRRDGMSVNLRGALEACAKAGIDMFAIPELRKTFCPSRDEYFALDKEAAVYRPRPDVFTGFDQVLDEGKIVGFEMPKAMYYDAAVFLQVALKFQWQQSVLRRDAIGNDGRLIMPPRFGERIGYCPTFMFADEAQISANPADGEFKAVCRSKRACNVELVQSHGSIKATFGSENAALAAVYFQNSMTHIYLRQSDLESINEIKTACGTKIVDKTTMAVSEGGSASELSFTQGGALVHDGLGVSATVTVATEEKPFIEVEELKGLANNTAVVIPSNGDRALPATITYLRPLWIQKKYPDLPVETPWLDWPSELRASYDLDSIPQELNWAGWGTAPLEADDIVQAGARLGRFVLDAKSLNFDPPAATPGNNGPDAPPVAAADPLADRAVADRIPLRLVPPEPLPPPKEKPFSHSPAAEGIPEQGETALPPVPVVNGVPFDDVEEDDPSREGDPFAGGDEIF